MAVQEVLPAGRILTARETTPFDRAFIWFASASCLLHIVLAIVITITPQTRRVSEPLELVTVDIVAPEEFERPSRRPDERPAPAPESAAEPANGMVHATHLYATDALAEPGSRQAREILPTLREDERILQLCILEAMEQVHRWKADYEPEFVIAYAMADAEITNGRVHADGGAFRSRDHWYNIKFECDVSPDLERVVDFAFSVGAEIPRSSWESYNLTADDGADD
jgi:hypothetical protein